MNASMSRRRLLGLAAGGMIDPGNVPDVTADEALARYVMHASHVRRSNHTVKPDACRILTETFP